jgi:hypothetical protein
LRPARPARGLCENAVLEALRQHLPADTVHMLVQQGRDTPLEEARGVALEETAARC